MNHIIYPLYNGSFNILMKSARSMEDIHCFAFLVVDENGEAVLVDTGFDPDAIPGANTALIRTEDQQVKVAIEKLGFDPAGIKDVIMTHIHWDHTCGMRDFPKPVSSFRPMSFAVFCSLILMRKLILIPTIGFTCCPI